MDDQNPKCLSRAVALAFFGGSEAGVVTGFLLTPKSGEEVSRVLKGYATKAEKQVLERAKDVEESAKTGWEVLTTNLDACCN
jgi:gas vesicle protein